MGQAMVSTSLTMDPSTAGAGRGGQALQAGSRPAKVTWTLFHRYGHGRCSTMPLMHNGCKFWSFYEQRMMHTQLSSAEERWLNTWWHSVGWYIVQIVLKVGGFKFIWRYRVYFNSSFIMAWWVYTNLGCYLIYIL